MKYKIFTVLAATMLLVGAGCANDVVDSNLVPQETPMTQKDEPAFNTGVTETEEPVATGEIGFDVTPPQSWGEFSVVLYKRTFLSNPEIGEDWEYQGSFSEQPSVYYRAAVPEHVIARSGYPGDVLGYKSENDNYYVNIGGKNWEKVPTSLTTQEVALKNGTALLIQGPQTSDGPSPFPNQPGQLVAYINTPNGPLPGGVFIADAASGVTIDEMITMLSNISI
ncbi:MAG: hypothetical protein WAZ14_00210 [Patescibacteria group bacterium]